AGGGAALRHRACGRLGRCGHTGGAGTGRIGVRAMTALFPPAAGPRLFTIAPGVDFAAALVDGLEARLAGHPPEAIAGVEIWVNTRRAQRALVAVLASGPARLLPRIRVLPELAAAMPGEATALGHRLALARLVAELLEAEPELAPRMAVFDLADSLAELL